MMKRASAVLALLSSLAATPAAAQVRLGEQLDAIRLAGSERMMVHVLSYKGLPAQARAAREKVLTRMGLRGQPGSVSGASFQFSPIMTHDSNINGGFASDSFTVAGIPFTIGEDYRAVGGLVLGVSGSGRARVALGNSTALDLRAGGSIGYAPEHDMVKTSLGGTACIEHMVSYSTYANACVDASYHGYELGESKRIGARVGMSHIVSSSVGVHEISASVLLNRHLNTTIYNQKIGSLSVSSAIPGPFAVNLGVQVGESVSGVKAMRYRAYAGLGFLAFDRPSSVSVSLQENEGGMWMGRELSETITSLGVRHQISKKLTVSASVSMIDSSDSFFDDTQYGVNFAWRF